MKMIITRAVTSCLWLMLACVCSFAQAKSNPEVIEVPFEFHHNEIILQVRVGGKGPFNMMLDTGTDPSAVDLATARELGLKLDYLNRVVRFYSQSPFPKTNQPNTPKRTVLSVIPTMC
jgi:Aspartyl protease